VTAVIAGQDMPGNILSRAAGAEVTFVSLSRYFFAQNHPEADGDNQDRPDISPERPVDDAHFVQQKQGADDDQNESKKHYYLPVNIFN
jgi:hypothetical protein